MTPRAAATTAIAPSIADLVSRAHRAVLSLPRGEARAQIIGTALATLIAELDADGLAQVGVGMVRQLEVVARMDADGADRVAQAIWDTLTSVRRESPTALSNWRPTEPVPTSPPGVGR
jgi:hypothetical protein